MARNYARSLERPDGLKKLQFTWTNSSWLFYHLDICWWENTTFSFKLLRVFKDRNITRKYLVIEGAMCYCFQRGYLVTKLRSVSGKIRAFFFTSFPDKHFLLRYLIMNNIWIAALSIYQRRSGLSSVGRQQHRKNRKKPLLSPLQSITFQLSSFFFCKFPFVIIMWLSDTDQTVRLQFWNNV